MTIKYLSGHYNGFNVYSGFLFNTLSIKSTGTVQGFNVANAPPSTGPGSAPGSGGWVGVTDNDAAVPVLNSGLVSGGAGGAGGTPANSGVIYGTHGGTGGYGVHMEVGGYLENLGTLGTIVGGSGGNSGGGVALAGFGNTGVEFATAGSLVNTGVIIGGAGGLGGGSTTGSGNGVAGEGSQGGWGVAMAGGSVFNSGTVRGGAGGGGGHGTIGVGGAAAAGGTAMELQSGVTLNNSGVVIGGTGGTGGVGQTTGGAGAVGGQGVDFNAAAVVSNTGTILGGAAGAGGAGGSAAGSAGIMGDGVYLATTASITNGLSFIRNALIEGATGVTTGFSSGAVTVTNYATIQGTSGVAVQFRNAADRLVDEAGSVLIGAVGGGGGMLELAGTGGTISGLGTNFQNFGSYSLDTGASWTMTGANTVNSITLANAGTLDLAGTLLNFGSIKGTAGYALTVTASGRLANQAGASVSGGVSVAGVALNLGTLSGSYRGAYVYAGGTVGNQSSGVIEGVVGIASAGTVTNYGSIHGTGEGILAFSGALTNKALAVVYGADNGVSGNNMTVANYGLIHSVAAGSYYAGVSVSHSSVTNAANGTIVGYSGLRGEYFTLTNSGQITGNTEAGVYVPLGTGQVTNKASGLIAGGLYGVQANGPTTVINFGSISGTLGSVLFETTGSRLIVDTGAVFTGKAVGGGGTLELNEGGGTISGLGATGALSGGVAMPFSGFGTYQLDSGVWTLSGSNKLSPGKTLTSSGTVIVAGTLIDQGVLVGPSMTIANAGILEVQGVVSNAGTIAVASTGSTTDLRILPAGVTLTGGGKIVLSGAKDRILGFSKTSTLTNVDNTIAGTCIFGAANLLTLVNESKGTIDATGVMTLDTSGSTVTNAGLMESTTGGLLTVSATTINQSGGGTLNAAGGMINLTGGSDIIGGVIASTTGWAVRALTGANMLDGTTSAVNLTGTLQVLGSDTLTVTGTIANSGKLNLYTGGTVIIGAGGATLLGAGQVNLTANAANDITATAAGATLTNAGNAIFGSGTIGGGTLSLVNQAAGVISNGLSVALTINTGSNTVINAGAIAATAAGGGVTVQSAVNNTGRLIANSGGTLTMNGAVTGAGIGQINGGELIIAQAFAENVFFLGKGVLELEDSTAYTGKVVGLSNAGTNSLDLTDITFTSGVTKATYSGTTASGTLTVTDGTHTANIKLIGNYTTAGAFVLSSDGHGGTTIVDPQPSTPAALTQAMASFQVGAAATPAGPSPGTSTNLPLIAAHG